MIVQCEIQHGTISAYRRHGCRCTDCRDAARASDREYWRRRGRQPQGNPCEVGGKTFSTQLEAARALGVSKSAITAALNRHGDLSRIGKPRSHSKGGRKCPVTVEGRTWPSMKSLAAYCGVTQRTIRRWLRDSPRRLLYAIRATDERLIAERMAADAKAASRRMVA